jgi:hypothetical protein
VILVLPFPKKQALAPCATRLLTILGIRASVSAVQFWKDNVPFGTTVGDQRSKFKAAPAVAMTQQPPMGQPPMGQPPMGQPLSANKASSVILKTSFAHLWRCEQVGSLKRGFAVQTHC